MIGAAAPLLLALAGSIPSGAPAPGGELRVGAVRVSAPPSVEPEEVVRILGIRPGEPFSRRILDRALKRLYLVGGYARASIEGFVEGSSVDLVVSVEGRPRYAGTRCLGDAVLSPEDAETAAGLRPGEEILEDRLPAVSESLLRLLAERGYFQARVDLRLVASGRVGEAILEVRVASGPRAKLAAIDLLGDPYFSPDLVLGRSGLAPGEGFDRKVIEGGVERIRAFYRGERFWQAEIPDAETAYDPIGNTVRVFVRIEAGDRIDFRVEESGRVSLVPDPVLRSKALDVTGLDKFHPLDAQAVETARDRLRAYYQSLGYYFAEVEASFRAEPERRLVRVRFVVVPGPLATIRSIRFEGNRALTAEQIQAQMRTRPWSVWGLVADFGQNGFLVERRLDGDLQSILNLYQRNGYLRARVTDRRVEADRSTGGLRLTIAIDEGPLTRVRSLGLEGGGDLGPRPERAIPLVVGAPFDPTALEEGKLDLLREELRRGFLEAEVTTAVTLDEEGTGAEIRVFVDEGPRSIMGSVWVRGTDRTHPEVVRREVTLPPGAPIDPGSLLTTQQHISRLGIFDSVRLTPVGEAGQPRDLLVRVRERDAGAVDFGGGYGTLDGIRGFAEVSHANMRGEAERLTIRGEGGMNVRALWPQDINHRDWPYGSADAAPSFGRGAAGYRWPSLFAPGWATRVNLSGLYDQRLGPHIVVYEASVGVEHEIAPHLRISPQYRVAFQESYTEAGSWTVKQTGDVFPRVVPSDEWVGAFGPTLVHDTRDDPFNPARGDLQVFEATAGHPVGGSDFPFLKVTDRSAFFHPLVPPLTGLLVLRGGWARLLDRPGLLPFYDRYRLGGATTVRGFQENGIGPGECQGLTEDPTCQNLLPRGGNILASYSAEMGFPLPPGGGLSGALFTDGGGVWDDLVSVTSREFRTSAGFGVRYRSPVGPLRADIGFKLDQRPGEPLTNFHFSIGQVF